MELNINILEEMVDKICRSDEIKISDIPDMDLYMDQLLTFLNGKLEPLKRDESDKLLTKTMINNYTKDKLLVPPHNKKYNREHLMQLILVYQLKNVLSIQDIKSLFRPILQDINTPEDDIIPLADVYSTFLLLKNDQFTEFCNHFAEKFQFIREKTSAIENQANHDIAELFLTVMMLVAQANASKRLAEKIIDDYFKDVNESDTDKPGLFNNTNIV